MVFLRILRSSTGGSHGGLYWSACRYGANYATVRPLGWECSLLAFVGRRLVESVVGELLPALRLYWMFRLDVDSALHRVQHSNLWAYGTVDDHNLDILLCSWRVVVYSWLLVLVWADK